MDELFGNLESLVFLLPNDDGLMVVHAMIVAAVRL